MAARFEAKEEALRANIKELFQSVDIESLLKAIVLRLKDRAEKECFICLATDFVSKKVISRLETNKAAAIVVDKRKITSKEKKALDEGICEFHDKLFDQMNIIAESNSLFVCKACNEFDPKETLLLLTESYSKHILSWHQQKLSSIYGEDIRPFLESFLKARNEEKAKEILQKVITHPPNRPQRPFSDRCRSTNTILDAWIIEFSSLARIQRLKCNVQTLAEFKKSMKDLRYFISVLLRYLFNTFAMRDTQDDPVIIHRNLLFTIYTLADSKWSCNLCYIRKYWLEAGKTITKDCLSNKSFLYSFGNAVHHAEQHISNVKKTIRLMQHFLLQYCAVYLVLHPHCWCMMCWEQLGLYHESKLGSIRSCEIFFSNFKNCQSKLNFLIEECAIEKDEAE